MQFFAPAVCLLAGQGLATLSTWLPRAGSRRVLLGGSFALYFAVATQSIVTDLVSPYKLIRDHRAREFAAWFWESQNREAEIVCARNDLGLVLDPAHWDIHFTEYYLTYQQMYSSRHRSHNPLRLESLSAKHPLRCVFFNESPERYPLFHTWLAEMTRTFDFTGSHTYTVIGEGPRGPDFANTYVVLEFIPKPGVAITRLPRAELLADRSGRVVR